MYIDNRGAAGAVFMTLALTLCANPNGHYPQTERRFAAKGSGVSALVRKSALLTADATSFKIIPLPFLSPKWLRNQWYLIASGRAYFATAPRRYEDQLLLVEFHRQSPSNLSKLDCIQTVLCASGYRF